MQVTRRIEISAGHRLLDYVGPCANVHGHNYVVEASVDGKVDDNGFVMDFKVLKEAMWEILGPFDHAMVVHNSDPLLQALMDGGNKIVVMNVNPTAENIASFLFTSLRRMNYTPSMVRIQETGDAWAVCTEQNNNVKAEVYA